ncbi:hypothetical protein quinque_001508 [Culex quinquefasciatus]
MCGSINVPVRRNRLIRSAGLITRLRSFGVKPILDYSVEEDLSQEEAEKREVEASVSSSGASLSGEPASAQFSVDKTFADRRYKVQSARTYFYLNEATCERNMETFLECLDAVKVMPRYQA